jgi:hypothetical protein
MGGMSELRYRRPDQATPPGSDEPQRRDPPYRGQDSPRLDRENSERTGIDVRPDRNDGRHDPDAAFKRPVPKPPGYLPDDTGGRASVWAALRRRGDRVAEPSQGHDPVAAAGTARREASAGAPRLPEGDDGGDAPRADIDRPDFRDPLDDRSPDRYGTPLTRSDGTRIPCLNGQPRREQTRQGWAGDCGIIATLGAVAAHMPEEITRRVRPREDGSYQVTLSEAHGSDGMTEPTGQPIELTVTPELPVYDENPGTPACAKTEEGTAWCAIMEKAFAGVDQTWTTQRRVAWMDDWAGMCAQDQADNSEEQRSGPAPTGYVRLHQGTTPWERAEALTQLTGQPAVVREFPAGRDEWTINRIIRAQLADDKPVLVSSRRKAHQRDVLPHDLKDGHVYEVTGVEKGRIILRNPWNEDHPQPMETDEFARNMGRYYSTLK